MIDYNNDDRTFVVNSAIKNNLGDKEEIRLYEELSLALELDENKNYSVIDSGIGNGINFNIITQYPDNLPDNVSTMFFNINNNFDVNILETNQCANVGERMFKINLKKL